MTFLRILQQPKFIQSLKLYIRKVVERRKYKYYKSIEFCPFWNFFKCIETEDYRYILKLDNYEDLPNTLNTYSKEFGELSYQYQDASDTIKSQLNRRKVQNTQEIRLKMLILTNCITLLSITTDKNAIDFITYHYPKTKDMTGNKMLEYLISQFKGLKTLYNNKVSELERGKSDNVKIDMYEILNALEQYKGYNINPHELTVKKFIALRNNFEKWAIHKQNEAAKIVGNGKR